MRLQNIKIGDYMFYIEDGKIYVRYTKAKEQDVIDLSALAIETIGITRTREGSHVITLITPASIQKLKNNITENLEAIGFKANTLKEALALVAFLTEWLDYLKDKNTKD